MKPLALLALPVCLLLACDDSSAAAKPDLAKEAADKKAAEDAALEKRRKDREAKAAAEKKAADDLAAEIDKVTAIPEGTKIPKKAKDACGQVVAAQEAFMKKFHPGVPPDALTTQLGLIRKQCLEMKQPKIAICQKFALEATTEQTKGAINDYLPKCMEKYGGA